VSTASGGTISDDRLGELLALIDESDSVELKLTVPESTQRSALAALDIDPLDAQIRQVFFFDTPDLVLDRAGVVVRARRVQGDREDVTVKLRPIDPTRLSQDLRQEKGFAVEVDAMPNGFVCSAAMGAKARGDVRAVAAGRAELSALLVPAQLNLLSERAPAGIDPDALSVLGPIFVLKRKVTPAGFARKLVVELWLYPDNTTVLELSTKCRPEEAFQIAAETRAYISGLGIPLDGEQQTKTRRALEFFSTQLAER
jgi:hypothetical protein